MTHTDYLAKLKRIDEIFDTDSEELLALVAEVEAYEKEHFLMEEKR
jgi:CBS-domain-containing membrane protein